MVPTRLKAEHVVPLDIQFDDIDALGHLNSSRAFSFAEHARVDWLVRHGFAAGPSRLPIIVASAHAEYHAPVSYGTPIEVAMRAGRVGSKSFDWAYEVRPRGGGPPFTSLTTTQVCYDYAAGRSIPIPPALRTALGGGALVDLSDELN